jgi:hypothetical protein
VIGNHAIRDGVDEGSGLDRDGMDREERGDWLGRVRLGFICYL